MQIDDIKLPLISCITDRNDINRTEKKPPKKPNKNKKERKKERKKQRKKENKPR